MSDNRDMLLDSLREKRPDIAVTVEWEIDHSFKWDGDGPDPEEEGLFPHDVVVTATAIRNGKIVEGYAYLVGCYSPFGGPHCPDIHGYFPQMLEEALSELDVDEPTA